MTDKNAPVVHIAPVTKRIERSVAFAAQFRPRVDNQGHMIGKAPVFTYDPETRALVSVTTFPDDAA